MYKKIMKKIYYQESLFCDCGQLLDDQNNKIDIETETIYKQVPGAYGGGTWEQICGRKWICPNCGKVHIENEFVTYPKEYCELEEIK